MNRERGSKKKKKTTSKVAISAARAAGAHILKNSGRIHVKELVAWAIFSCRILRRGGRGRFHLVSFAAHWCLIAQDCSFLANPYY